MQGRLQSLISGLPASIPVIAVLIGVAGCGGDATAPVAKDACGSDAQPLAGPGATLTYRGRNDVVADVPILCERLKALKARTRVRGVGRERLVVEVPAQLAAAARLAAQTGALAFYDWEANVIGPDGRQAPADRDVTGGSAAGQLGAVKLYDAVLRASKRAAIVEPDNAREGSRWYAVDAKARVVYGTGSATRSGALAAVPRAERAGATLVEVKPGTVVVRAEQMQVDDRQDAWFVLEDDAALRGTDVVDPEQRVDDGPGATGAPIVTFGFTDEGAQDFHELTRELATRGSRSAGADTGTSAMDANQHFAIVLDDQVVSVPFVDFRRNPGGIDGASGAQIQGGFTLAYARALASLLRTGALEVPLEPAGPPAP